MDGLFGVVALSPSPAAEQTPPNPPKWILGLVPHFGVSGTTDGPCYQHPHAQTLTGEDTASAGLTLGSWLVPSPWDLPGPGTETPLPLSSPSPDFSPG